MITRLACIALVAPFCIVFGALAAPPLLAQGSTMRASVSFAGEQANAQCWDPVISADGRYVAYVGGASNLIEHDNNSWPDIFVHDRQTGHVELITVSPLNPVTNANGYSQLPSISDCGRYVAFSSHAANLVPNDTNGRDDIFVRDRQAGTTTRVSVSSSGLEANDASIVSAISADGSSVAFESAASNLVLNDTNGWRDVFVRQAGATTRVSVSSAGVEGDLESGTQEKLSISGDGRYVAFDSLATNLVAGDTNGVADVFVHDRQFGTTQRVSVSASNVQANGASKRPWLSNNGDWLAFTSLADNLVANDNNAYWDVFLRERATGTILLASRGLGGTDSDGNCFDPVLTPDGTFVVFTSEAGNLVAGDTNATRDTFLRSFDPMSLSFGPTERVSVTSMNGESNGSSDYPAVSSNARFIAFYSVATNLVSNDTNLVADVFVRDRSGCSPTVATYCTAGTTSQGCVPRIGGVGTPSATVTSGFSVTVTLLETQKTGLLFYGVSGPLANAWNGGSSFLCIKTPVQRTGVQDSGGVGACGGSISLDWNSYAATHPLALGMPFSGSEVVWVQGWFRDPQAPGGTNLSDGLWFQVCP